MGNIRTRSRNRWTQIIFPVCCGLLLSILVSSCDAPRNNDPILSIRPVPTEAETFGVLSPSIATYIPPTPTPAPIAITFASVSEITILRRLGTGFVREVHWSEDGNQLIVITYYGVYLYDAETLNLEESFILESEYVLAEISPSGMYAVVVDIEGNSNLRDIRTGSDLRELRDDWSVLNWSTDSSRLVIGHRDGSVHVVDTPTGELVWDFTLSRFEIEEVTFSQSGGLVMAKDDEGWFVFWELSDGSELLRDRIMLAREIQITPDENAFVFISGLGTLNVWKLPEEWIRWEIKAEVYGPKVDRFVIHPDGEKILLSYQTRTVNEVRDLNTGEKLGVTAYPEDYEGGINPVHEIKFKIRDQTEIEIRETAKNSLIVSTSIADFGQCLAFSASEEVFATNFGLWDVWTGERIFSFDGDCPITFSSDGVNLGFKKTYRSISVLDISDLEELGEFACRIFDRYSADSLINFDINAGGSMIACYPGGERVYVYDVATNEQLLEFRTIQYDTAIKFSADGRYLGALSHGFLRVWDLEEGYLIHDPIRVEEPVGWRASDDLMSWVLHYREGRDSIATWDPKQSKEQSRIWLETEAYITSLLSPDGMMLVLARSDRIEIWNTSTGEVMVSKEWPRGIPMEVRLAFSPDSNWLAMYIPGGPVWIWGVTE